jgi:hypothetical protein
MKSIIALATGLTLLAGAAQASILQSFGTGLGSTLFTAEVKRDENVQNNGQRGHDVFLRNGAGSGSTSKGLDFGASGTVYDWSLSYDGDTATLAVDTLTRTLDVDPDGIWNLFRVYARAADSGHFTTATATLNILGVNGSNLANPTVIAATDGFAEAVLALGGPLPFTSLSGTLQFDFDPKPGAKGSPDSSLVVGIEAFEVSMAFEPILQGGPSTSAVPVPAGVVLMGSLIAAAGAWSGLKRRRG